MSPAGAARVAFLDDDHVLRMVADLFSARTEEDLAGVDAFFAPDRPERAELERLRAGVTTVSEPADASVLVLRRGAVDEAVLATAPGLRLVQRLGARCDGLDLAAARAHGVEVSCLPRPSLERTAEHAILLMLALVKRLVPADRAARRGVAAPPDPSGSAHNWAGLTGLGGLSGRVLGIVGLGEVGRLVAHRARAFGMRVLYTGRTRLPARTETELGVEHRTLDALLAGSDVVSLHVPGPAVSGPLIGRAELAAMRPGALLVNTGRGVLVDEDALYAALRSGRLGGAGLDVHAVEPRPADDRLCALDSVVLTPHIAGGSRLEVLVEVARMVDNVRAVLDGGVPVHGRVLP